VQAHKLAEAAKIATAKRGNFCLIERRHSYTSLLHSAYAGNVGWTPVIVSSVTRDGIVKEVRLADGRTLKRRDWDYCHVDSKGLIANPALVCEQLRQADHPRWAIEYHDCSKTNAAIKAAAGL
jgi:hypothetical protein